MSSGAGWPRPIVAWSTVVVLVIVFIVSWVDRMILNLLIPQIKVDLDLSDTQIALVVGYSFSLFYALMGIPIGRWADRSNRKRIIMIGLAGWTAMTALTSAATSFARLLIARMGVGVGEATLGPSAMSMISDNFPPEKRTRPVAVFTLGGVLGVSLAYFLGGAVIEYTKAYGNLDLATLLPFLSPGTVLMKPWQWAFIIIASPGILALALMAMVREPARKGAEGGDNPSLREVLAFVRSKWKMFLAIYGTVSLHYFFMGATITWTPTLFMRRFAMSEGEVGILLGANSLVVGVAGTFAVAFLSDWLRKRGRQDALLIVTIGCIAIGGPLMAISGLLPTPMTVYWTHVAASFILTGVVALPLTAIQVVSPNKMRGLLTAILFFFVNAVGMGTGPLLAGLFNDYLFRDPGMVHYSLALVGAIAVPIALVCGLIGLPEFRRDVAQLTERAKEGDPDNAG